MNWTDSQALLGVTPDRASGRIKGGTAQSTAGLKMDGRDTGFQNGRDRRTYDNRYQLTVMKVSAEVTVDDLIAGIRQYYDKSLAGNLLWDFLDAALESMSTEDFNATAETAAVRIDESKQGKTALVAGTNFNMGLGVMWRAVAHMAGIAHEYRFFRNMADAVEWLNSPS